jgi:hypothetical protein
MKPSPCPHCGISMWIELNGDAIRHPTQSDCQLNGRAFRVRKKHEKDRRPTWEEYAAKYASSTPQVETGQTPAPALENTVDLGDGTPTTRETPKPPSMPGPAGPQIPE